MNDSTKLRVIAYREADLWVAQCLEYDIGAQGKTLEQLTEHFDLTVKADLAESLERHGEAFKGIAPAPQHFHDLWETSAGTYEPTRKAGDGPEYELALVA